MRFKRSLIVNAIILALLPCGLFAEAIKIGPHFWPTPNTRFLESAAMEGVVQPTVSGNITSGLFGCVRNDGHRFHEGVDLAAISRDRRNEPIDPVYAFDEGVVRYVNLKPGTSQYGRYIVIEHPQIAAGLVTLYAHLREVPLEIEVGVSVKGGQTIATMGRSSGGYVIPRQRAHLHFEVGFWMGNDFQKWYDAQPFGSLNDHGAYNGMNIIGVDVWEMFRAIRSGEVHDVWEFLESEPIAVQLFIRDSSIPELLRVNPHLMENSALPADHVGWRIQFTWYGLPISFRALVEEEFASSDFISVVPLRPDLMKGNYCMDLVRDGRPSSVGPKLMSTIQRLFLK